MTDGVGLRNWGINDEWFDSAGQQDIGDKR